MSCAGSVKDLAASIAGTGHSAGLSEDAAPAQDSRSSMRRLLHLLTVAFGTSRQAAFFGPTVANGALRTCLDLQLAPALSD